ncbi:Hypothetical protein NTJ_14070 [Nesidiocoris tenuis]|uniref:Uncharacterized protein n=1 Tax=Nesidiocoris tenuis TaxID=355587 RepID=A0ABN7BAB9_9HEMI|nr:Hypothetical protein NTJ_14070 [Nesidiocoris tenuis]
MLRIQKRSETLLMFNAVTNVIVSSYETAVTGGVARTARFICQAGAAARSHEQLPPPTPHSFTAQERKLTRSRSRELEGEAPLRGTAFRFWMPTAYRRNRCTSVSILFDKLRRSFEHH